MSIFGKIMGAIFGTKAEAAEPAGGAGSAVGGGGATVPMVDVAPILDKAVAAKGVVELTEMPHACWNFLLLHLHPQFFRIELEELVVDFLDSSLSFSP